MHQIAADGMPPMDGAVKCAVRVVLVKHVILTIPFDQTIWIVHPVIDGQEMKSRPMPVGHTLYVWIV